MKHAGELAALGTALCWATGFNLFSVAGQRMGSVVLNRLRLVAAMLYFALALLVVRGAVWPVWATRSEITLLVISGLLGFVFGDGAMFRALVILGPGRAGLMTSLSPLFTVALAWPILGERPGALALAGMLLIVGGIGWVMIERERRDHTHPEGSVAMGVVSGVLGALGQSGGYVCSKLALRQGIDPLSASMVRINAAVAGIWLIATLRREAAGTLRALRDRTATAFMLSGALLGPFVGALLSLYALKGVQAGIATSIIAFFPVFTMLIAAAFYGEKLTLRMLGGALVATAGVVVLFLR